LQVQVLEKTPNSVKLYIKGVSLHVLNSIRRAAMSEVPTMAIDYVIFIENSSVFYDEYIAHRLGLIPLKSGAAYDRYRSPEECAEAGEKRVFSADCFAKFDLEVENPSNGILTVYSKDLIPGDPQVTPVYDNIPVAKLIKGQKIKLEAFARLGRGKEHVKWSPVTVATHKYVPVITVKDSCTLCGKCIDVCPRKVLLRESSKVVVDESKILLCILCKLCEEVCNTHSIKVSHRENEYILYLELTGSLGAKAVLVEAANIVLRKLDELESKLKGLGVI